MDKLAASFSLSKLWPEFSSIFDGRFSTNIGLSAFIVGILLVVFVCSAIYVGRHWYKSTKRIKFFMGLLHNSTTEDLSKKRQDLLHESEKDKKNGALWKEFDETLITSADGELLYNTVDSSHFFNTSTLASEITENRLLTAVPAFLTAIGVIGTFAGLQMGLSGLSISKDVGIDVLREGIGHLINGASIAFLTSVWGVFASLVFNVIEKYFEKSIRKKISILQDKIDYLYPRVNAEDALVKISDYSRTSTELLKTLAEKIGDKMQEAMVEVSTTIQGGLEDSLKNIMGPAIQSLVTNSNKGAETAMDSLLSRFMDKMGDQGENQRNMLEKASNNVNDAMGSLGEKMNGFLEKFEQQQELLQQNGKQNAEDIKNTILSTNQKSREAIDHTVEAAESTTRQLAEGFQIQLESQKARDENRDERFKEQASELQSTSQGLMAQLNGMMENQKEVSGVLLGQSKTLMRDMERVTLANKEAAQGMHDATKDLILVGADFKSVGNTIEKAGTALSDSITKAIQKADRLTEINQSTASQVGQLSDSVGQIKTGIVTVTDKLVSVTEQADKSFVHMRKHQEDFQQALDMQVKNLETDIVKVIAEYGERVNGQTIERLKEWNIQTSQYTSTMTDAISSLSTVVDEIEAKMSPA
jgi:hypothetical protein